MSLYSEQIPEGYTLTILGCGTMGTAVLSAILNSSDAPKPGRVICCVGSKKSAEKLKSSFDSMIETIHGGDNNQAVKEANVILLGCKPYMCEKVLGNVSVPSGTLVISLVAGWTLGQLSQAFNGSCPVVRVMTNTPAKFGCGMAVISLDEKAEHVEEFVKAFVSPVGDAIVLPESKMDVATSLVGSGPAFCLLFMESMIDGAVKMGMSFADARKCAAKVMEGTAKMCIATEDHPAALKSAVCTPGGTTIGGLMVMEDKNVRSGIARGVQEAAEIAATLGKK